MSTSVQRVFTYIRQNPIAVYIGGGLILHQLRMYSVQKSYQENYARYDVERQVELQEYLSHGLKGAEQKH